MVRREIPIPSLEEVKEEREKLKRKKEYNRAVRNTIYILVVVAAIAVLISTLFISVLQVSGTSMEPNLNDGDIIVLLKQKSFETGDLCGFYYQNKILLKRVIGLPGDYVNINDEGTVFVNGKELEEPYVVDKSLGISDIEYPYQVPDGKIFVLGDHRATSIDSRSTQVGSIESEHVVGRVWFRLWAFNRISTLTQ